MRGATHTCARTGGGAAGPAARRWTRADDAVCACAECSLFSSRWPQRVSCASCSGRLRAAGGCTARVLTLDDETYQHDGKAWPQPGALCVEHNRTIAGSLAAAWHGRAIDVSYKAEDIWIDAGAFWQAVMCVEMLLLAISGAMFRCAYVEYVRGRTYEFTCG